MTRRAASIVSAVRQQTGCLSKGGGGIFRRAGAVRRSRARSGPEPQAFIALREATDRYFRAACFAGMTSADLLADLLEATARHPAPVPEETLDSGDRAFGAEADRDAEITSG
jgi:predicted RNA-binding Zn ribbon-like protein